MEVKGGGKGRSRGKSNGLELQARLIEKGPRARALPKVQT
jgi:hypothetical protein